VERWNAQVSLLAGICAARIMADGGIGLVRTLAPPDPRAVQGLRHSARALGVSERSGDGGPPPAHAAIAAAYAHVTAPIRRLADRVANEIALALSGGAPPPAWALEALPLMPDLMRETASRARAAERAALDYVEAVVLAPRVGETFHAVVVDVRDDRPVVQIAEPAVLAALDREGPRPGDELEVRLSAVDPAARRVVLAPA
jgi:exoribonuclease R